MTIHKLEELLGEYALANPTRRLSTVTLVEFSEWYVARTNLDRVPALEPRLARLVGGSDGR